MWISRQIVKQPYYGKLICNKKEQGVVKKFWMNLQMIRLSKKSHYPNIIYYRIPLHNILEMKSYKIGTRWKEAWVLQNKKGHIRRNTSNIEQVEFGCKKERMLLSSTIFGKKIGNTVYWVSTFFSMNWVLLHDYYVLC